MTTAKTIMQILAAIALALTVAAIILLVGIAYALQHVIRSNRQISDGIGQLIRKVY